MLGPSQCRRPRSLQGPVGLKTFGHGHRQEGGEVARGGEEGRVHQRLRDPVPGGGAGSRCREPVLAAPPARAVVLVGSVARFAFSEHLHRDVSDHLLGPVDVGGRGRLLVSLRHPNSRGGVKSFQGQLGGSQLAQVREALSAPTPG